MRSTSIAFCLAAMASSALGFAPGATFGRTRVSSSLYAEVQKGTVKWFNTVKGFGFIVPEDGSGDVFVHQTAVKADGFRSLADGEEVEYSTEIGDDGRIKAVDVTGPDGANVQGAPFAPRDDFGY